MTHPLEGATRFITATTASAGAGQTIVNLQPAAGCVWEIIWAWAFQDDGAVWHEWQGVDPDTTMTLTGVIASGANDALPLGPIIGGGDDPNYLVAPMVVTYNRYVRYWFTASAAAKNGTLRAVVREYRGVAVEA